MALLARLHQKANSLVPLKRLIFSDYLGHVRGISSVKPPCTCSKGLNEDHSGKTPKKHGGGRDLRPVFTHPGGSSRLSACNAVQALQPARQYSNLSSGVEGHTVERKGHGAETLQASWNLTKSMVTVNWPDLDHPSYFPFVWLRDSCQCDKCVNPGGDRIQLLADLDPEMTARHLWISNNNLGIIWDDGHVSKYDGDWLHEHRFPTVLEPDRRNPMETESQLWDADFLKQPPKLKFEDLMADDANILQWIRHIEVHGFCILEGAPKDSSTLQMLSDCVARPESFPYGGHFDLRSNPGADGHVIVNPFELHTALPMMDDPCFIFLQHCMKLDQPEGTMCEFSDGFKAALVLKEESPQHFELLMRPVTFHQNVKTSLGLNLLNCQPVISLDTWGQPRRIVFSNHYRTPRVALPVDEVANLYSALKAFHEVLHRPGHLLRFRLQEGEIVCVNNFRVLHARKGWSEDKDSVNHISLMFLARDGVISRRRVLAAELQS